MTTDDNKGATRADLGFILHFIAVMLCAFSFRIFYRITLIDVKDTVLPFAVLVCAGAASCFIPGRDKKSKSTAITNGILFLVGMALVAGRCIALFLPHVTSDSCMSGTIGMPSYNYVDLSPVNNAADLLLGAHMMLSACFAKKNSVRWAGLGCVVLIVGVVAWRTIVQVPPPRHYTRQNCGYSSICG
jgi:hypothetical protein